mmetsp:Transcript_34708/g.99916  ORF Transcript_34708/g.99916 Transcript_34708/m.99916 type:complete len:146 (+) Transcript_34708:61-498(+)
MATETRATHPSITPMLPLVRLASVHQQVNKSWRESKTDECFTSRGGCLCAKRAGGHMCVCLGLMHRGSSEVLILNKAHCDLYAPQPRHRHGAPVARETPHLTLSVCLSVYLSVSGSPPCVHPPLAHPHPRPDAQARQPPGYEKDD